MQAFSALTSPPGKVAELCGPRSRGADQDPAGASGVGIPERRRSSWRRTAARVCTVAGLGAAAWFTFSLGAATAASADGLGSLVGDTTSTAADLAAPVVASGQPVVVTAVSVVVPVVTPVAQAVAAPVAPAVVPVAPVFAPVVSVAAPVVSAAAPVAQSAAPVVSAAAPVTQAVAPVISAAAPVVSAVAPVAQSAAPVVSAAAPVIVPVVEAVAPVTAVSTPVVAPVQDVTAPVPAVVPPVTADVVAPVAPIDPTSVTMPAAAGTVEPADAAPVLVPVPPRDLTDAVRAWSKPVVGDPAEMSVHAAGPGLPDFLVDAAGSVSAPAPVVTGDSQLTAAAVAPRVPPTTAPGDPERPALPDPLPVAPVPAQLGSASGAASTGDQGQTLKAALGDAAVRRQLVLLAALARSADAAPSAPADEPGSSPD